MEGNWWSSPSPDSVSLQFLEEENAHGNMQTTQADTS